MMTQGDLAGVIEMLENAERLYYRHPIPDVRPLAALITRAWLMQGKLTEALLWVHERDLSVGDDLTTCVSSNTSRWPGYSSPRIIATG